jgi:hypothetical protein
MMFRGLTQSKVDTLNIHSSTDVVGPEIFARSGGHGRVSFPAASKQQDRLGEVTLIE